MRCSSSRRTIALNGVPCSTVTTSAVMTSSTLRRMAHLLSAPDLACPPPGGAEANVTAKHGRWAHLQRVVLAWPRAPAPPRPRRPRSRRPRARRPRPRTPYGLAEKREQDACTVVTRLTFELDDDRVEPVRGRSWVP